MNIDKPYTPEALCDRKMLVPIYQRLFVWDEDRIRKLLDDLFVASKDANVDVPYYIGIITVHEKDGAWEIVDGQQRLTFLTLLGCALNRHGAISQKPDGSKTWKDFVLLPQDGSDDNKNRISYVGRRGDEDVVRNWWNSKGTLDFAGLSESFGTFYNVFERFLNDHQIKTPSPSGDGNSDELQKFGEYCFTKASFLINCLPQEYGPFDLNLYFEKMNSTGKQLEPIDVVKGKWFSSPKYVGKFNMCMNLDKTYEEQKQAEEKERQKENRNDAGPGTSSLTIADIVSPGNTNTGLNDDAGDVGSSLENRLPMKPEVLLLHVLKLCLKCWNGHQKDKVDVVTSDNVSFDSKSLIKTFSAVFADGGGADKEAHKECFINDLVAYRSWIDKNIIYLKGSGQSYDYEFRGKENSGNEIPTPEQQFQAMLYVASGDSQEWVLDAYEKCPPECRCGQKELTLDVLKECGVVAKHKPGEINAKKLSYHVIDRYWLWRLDYELWSIVDGLREDIKDIGVTVDDGMRDVILHYRFRRNISIEHLHPQSISGTEIEGDKWGTRDVPDSAMHQFGNLAMMSVECNSAQSNDGIGTKFGRVKDWIASGRLESIKMLVMFALAEGNANNWTTNLSEKHCEKMMEILGCNRSVSNAEVPK